MESRKLPQLGDIGEELFCKNPSHNKKRYEFVCTKRECNNKLACPQCLLTDHAEHFQWMVVIEDFFVEKPQQQPTITESDDKISMQDFVKDKQALLEKFDLKVSEEKKKVLSSLEAFKNKFLDKYSQLEKQIEEKTEKYRKSFNDDIEVIRSYLSTDEDVKFPDVISDINTLHSYLEHRVSKENDLMEKKFERTFESLKDHLNALSLMEFNNDKSQELLESMNNLLNFSLKLDGYRFYKKIYFTPISKLDYSKLTCKRVINTSHKKAIYKVIFIQDETKIATCSDDHTIMLYDMKSGDALSTLTGHTDRIWSIIKLRNGNLASCSSDNTIRIWNTQKGTCEKVLHGHSGLVCCLVEFPNLMLLSGSQDKCLKYWDLKLDTKNCVRTIKTTNMGRIMVIILLDSDYIACGSENNIQIIKFEDGTLKQTLSGHTALVRDLFHLEEKKQLISGSDDKSIRLWNLEDGKCLKTFNGHNHSANKILLFNPGIIVSASDDHTIKFWDIEAGTCNKTLTGHEGWVIHIAIMSDGTLLSCGADKTIRLWGI